MYLGPAARRDRWADPAVGINVIVLGTTLFLAVTVGLFVATLRLGRRP